LLLCLVFVADASCEKICPDNTAIAPCKCYEVSKQIVCSDPTLKGDDLHKAFQNVNSTFNILHIHDTKQPLIIKNGTFGKSKFGKIFIVRNDELTEIEELAFQSSDMTTALVINNNPKLLGTHLFAIANKLGAQLEYVEFDKNGISEIKTKAFNDPTFAKLKHIRLDAQSTGLKRVAADTFGQLPELRQLSLDHNNLETLDDNSIDLTATKLNKTDHISLFLNNNKLKDLTKEQVKFDLTDNKPSIGLVLEHNEINTLKAGLFDIIAKKQKSFVYLKGNNITECICDEIFIKGISDAITARPDGIRGLEGKPCNKKDEPLVKLDFKCT
jgi:Leucine-rich repeat (LRR) protein